MKRRISDMLEGISDQSVELNNDTPLSSERIRELTMSKIGYSEKKGKRTGFRLLVAVAVVAALTVTAVAAEEVFGAGDWFRQILKLQLEEDGDRAEESGIHVQETLQEGQVEVVNRLGKVFEEESQTSEGTTVTMHAAYGDESILHLYLSVEAPVGTALPDDIYYTFHDGNARYEEEEARYVPLTPAEDAPYKTISQQVDVLPLPDEDPADNKKDFHVIVNGQAGTDCRFNDGYSKFFHIRGIWQQVVNVNGDEDGYALLAPGEFSFDVGLTGEPEVIELKEAEGFAYGGEKSRTWTHDSPCLPPCEEKLNGETDPETGLPIHEDTWNYLVTVKELSISSMGVDYHVEYTCDDKWKGFGLSFQVVMKDGTSPITGRYGSGSDRPMEEANGIGESWGVSYFTVPIDLREVDYILIGDEELGDTMKISIPTT